jgi:hypothetical protein
MKKIIPLCCVAVGLVVPSMAFADKVEVAFTSIPSKVVFSGGVKGIVKTSGKRATYQFRGKPPIKVCAVVNGSSSCQALVPGQRYQTFKP